ncbi:MAG: phage virion morphogenesis protein [Desulfovibrionaceae bacterium]
MAGASIRLDFNEQASAAYARAQRLGEDLTPLNDSLGGLLVASTQERFEVGTAPDGTKWAPSGAPQTLVGDGHLLDSISHVADGHSVEWGSRRVYALIHQLGGVIKPKNAKALKIPLPDGTFALVQSVTMPARPYLGISDQDASDIEAEILDFINGCMGRMGSA